MKRLFIPACGALLAMAMFSTFAAAEIRIGVVGPMSGQYIAFGRQMRRGVEMAVKEINAAGGINGEKITLAIGDDRCDAGKAVEVAEKMAAQKAVLVVGHFCSAASIDASRIYAREKIVQISPASSNPVFTEERPGPGVFLHRAIRYSLKSVPGPACSALSPRTLNRVRSPALISPRDSQARRSWMTTAITARISRSRRGAHSMRRVSRRL
jgi:hypothetical protein